MTLVAINLHNEILYYLVKQPITPKTIIVNLRHFPSYLCCSKIVMVVMPCRFSLGTITTGCKCPFVPRTGKNEITLQVQHRKVMFVNTQIPKISIFLMCKYTKYVTMQNMYIFNMQIQLFITQRCKIHIFLMCKFTKYVNMQNMYIFHMQINKICSYAYLLVCILHIFNAQYARCILANAKYV